MKKYIIIAVSFLVFPALVFAKGSWTTREEGSTIFIEGECFEEKMRIELFGKAEDKDPIFTSDASCKDGKFSFFEELSRGNLPEGNYVAAVDGEKSWNTIAVKKSKADTGKNPTAPVPQPDIATSPDMKFIGAFVVLQQSILDMREWLAETQYPALVKTSMEFALDGLDLAVSKVSELVLSSESAVNAPAAEADAAENIPPTTEPTENTVVSEVPEENAEIPADAPEDQPTEVTEDSILSADGLNISDSR